jgi:hypothetical protein
MLMRMFAAVCTAGLMCGAAGAAAQEKPATPTAKPEVAVAKPVPPGPPSRNVADLPNIRVELRITDTYGGAPVDKTVSMVLLSGFTGRIRTSNMVPSGRPELKGMVVPNDPDFGREMIQLNVDAIATAVSRDLIDTRVTVEYRPAPSSGQTNASPPASLNESLQVLLKDGQPLVVSQSADPATERKVIVQVTATLVK